MLATASSLESVSVESIDDLMSLPDELRQHVHSPNSQNLGLLSFGNNTTLDRQPHLTYRAWNRILPWIDIIGPRDALPHQPTFTLNWLLLWFSIITKLDRWPHLTDWPWNLFLLSIDIIAKRTAFSWNPQESHNSRLVWFDNITRLDRQPHLVNWSWNWSLPCIDNHCQRNCALLESSRVSQFTTGLVWQRYQIG